MMDMYPKYKSRLGYATGDNKIDSYGVDHSGFTTRDELEYQRARTEREQQLIWEYNRRGMANNYPQYGTNFWGNPENNYGFGSSNIHDNIENMQRQPLDVRENSFNSYSQSYHLAQDNLQNIKREAENKVNYSLYGDGFSKEFIDEMLKDKEYQRALQEYAIPNEGGYVNNPKDPGGETNMGISKRYHPDEDIKNLTRERANAIIYRDFYKWNGIYKLPYPIKGVVVDYGMPTSPLNAIKTVHKVLELPSNGNIIGSATLEKLKKFSPQDYESFLRKYKQYMNDYYIDIAVKDKSQKGNLAGWLNRANRAHLAN